MLFGGGEISWVRFSMMSLFVQWVSLSSAGLPVAVRRVGVEPPGSIRTTELQPAGPANAQPTRVVVQVAREGVEPTITKV